MKIVHKLWLMLTALVAIVWIVGIYAAVISQDGLRAAVQIGAMDEAQTVIESIDHSVDSEVRQWDAYAHSDGVRAALRVSNQRFAELENAETFVQQQDELWRDRGEDATAEIRRVLAQPLSSELSERIEVIANGLDYRPVTEVLVTNRHGANAAQSDITGNYCQSAR